MCTLVLDYRRQDVPIVVAANRDERADRASETWQLQRTLFGTAFIAPRDVEAGGTWIGISKNGLFAALTNHSTGRAPDPALRSRGDLVAIALDQPTAAEAARAVRSVPASAFNPFHLVIADADHAFLWHTDGHLEGFDELERGLHVMLETRAHGDDARGELIRSRWPDPPAPTAVQSLLSIHDDNPREGTCLHVGNVYATRSSAFCRLDRALQKSSLLVVDTSPCQRPYEDRAPLLDALLSA